MLAEVETGKESGHNIYGSHPIYLVKEQSGKYHVVFMLNSCPMDVIVGEK